MKAQFKPLDPKEFVKAEVYNLPPLKEGENVYNVDLVRSGIPFHNAEWTLMYENSKPYVDSVVLVNHLSGQRLEVKMSSLSPMLQESIYTDPKPTEQVIFSVDRHGNIAWAEFGPNQYQQTEVFVNMGYGILFRMDYFLNNEEVVVKEFLEQQLGAIPNNASEYAQAKADYHQIAKRVRALMGIDVPTIYNDFPNQTVTPIGLND